MEKARRVPNSHRAIMTRKTQRSGVDGLLEGIPKERLL